MSDWIRYSSSIAQALCSSFPGKISLYLLACFLGVEVGTICSGNAVVGVKEAISTILTMPLVLALFGQPFFLVAYPVLVVLFVFLLIRESHWGTVLAVISVVLLIFWFGIHLYSHCHM